MLWGVLGLDGASGHWLPSRSFSNYRIRVATLSPDRVLKLLQSEDVSQRRKAVEKLGAWGPLRALPHLLKVRRDEEDEELKVLAAEKLKSMGAVIDLTPMGADTWFDQVKDSSQAFETLCEVMGERFVGYALIVGVQISGLTIDQFTPANTLVEFRLVESTPPRTLRLPDFRRELIGWILSEAPEPESAALPLDLAQAQQLVGVRYILLAPLHQMSLREVILETPGRKPQARVVVEDHRALPEEVEVKELRRRLHEEVEAELESVKDEPFELDFGLVDAAEQAAESEDWEDVLKLIGHWPGPLSMLSRMQMGANLDDDKRSRIGAALAYLALAYRATGRSAWAEELYRLGLQFAGEGPQGAKLYQALGESMLQEKRFGESVGPFRRALALGAPMEVVGPGLGNALSRCGRLIAAVAVLEHSLKEGAAKVDVLPILKRVYSSLADSAARLRELHDDWTSEDELSEAEDEDEGVLVEGSGINADDSTLEISIDEAADATGRESDD